MWGCLCGGWGLEQEGQGQISFLNVQEENAAGIR